MAVGVSQYAPQVDMNSWAQEILQANLPSAVSTGMYHCIQLYFLKK